MDVRNEVFLVGRLAAPAEQRELPSGDVITTWRLVVDRPEGEARGRGANVDALECVSRRAPVQRVAATWAPGDVVAVEGALRRRFWRGAGGLASRYEVEILKARRVAKAA